MLRRIKVKTICFCSRILEALENNLNANISEWKNQWVFQV
jgi:hypothetical protein